MNKKMRKRVSDYGKSENKSYSKKEIKDFEIPESLKKQILGFLLILFSLLILLCVLSYSPKDLSLLPSINFSNFFSFKVENLSNLFGPAGAILADFLVAKLFGYYSLSISVILFVIGLLLIRKKSITGSLTFCIYLIIFTIVVAASTSILNKIFNNSIPQSFRGNSGDFFAELIYRVFGLLGASIIFFFALAIMILLIIDSNILKSLARLQLLMKNIAEKFRKEKTNLQQRKKEQTEKKEKEKTVDSPYKEVLEKERERIERLKKKLDKEPEELIKETEINRPEETTEIKRKDTDKEKRIQIDTEPGVPATETSIKIERTAENYSVDSSDTQDIEEKLENYKKPSLKLLVDPTKEETEVISDEELSTNGRLLQEKLLMFGITIDKVYATPGPVVTLYELVPAPDVKLSKIESLQDDIALAMKARGIRMIIPIPGRGTVGVEIPNQKAQIVRIKSILSSPQFFSNKAILPIAFGKTIDGQIYLDDLSVIPHILIAGATGSGKSVCINTVIASLLYKLHPSDLKFVLIDPKKIELSLYSKLRKHFLAISPDINESIVTTPANAVAVLKSVEIEMEQRYDKLANAGVRNIEAYNEKFSQGKLKDNELIKHKKMPYLVVIIDELADLIMTAKRDIEEPITRIAQMARAVGIHLILATQRPSVDVITGVIKANFPVRIAFQVASKFDSRTILDMSGAEQLLRNGDMLYQTSSSPKPIRIQNAFITTEECEKIVEFIGNQQGFSKPYILPSLNIKSSSGKDSLEERDEMFEEAVRLILKLQQCSTSTLQRRLKLGYARAARIVDQMEAAGIVGPANGAKGREILITEDEIDKYL